MATDTSSYEVTEYVPIGDVARRFGVTPQTVRSWEAAGKLRAVRTPGGQRRFSRAEVDALELTMQDGAA